MFREFARRFEEISLELDIRKKVTIGKVVPPRPKVKKIEEFPALDNEALSAIENVWFGSDPLEKRFGEGITRKDLLTLRGLEWLNDEVINTYLGLVCERARQDTTLPKVYAFTTFFYTNLAQHGYNKVKRWTKKVDIFSYDILLVPVHLGAHWCLAVIDLKLKFIHYYDSLGGSNDHCLDLLKSYLNEESIDKRKKSFEVTDWEFRNAVDIPLQMNGSDCGMFTCKFAEFAARRAKVVFGQKDMPYYRKRMVYEICRKRLL
ncbi:unnamed protein product [Enterobius vermicularis]|uniref:Ubiquitin-like protease family profile domain-containing protein n=1 Tax=Enterobius vermicularis TaxID=51028 RepID=A0A3P6IEA5_ENTVE|nr:unnamed protein product [Enterobius vermicularis]